MAQHTLHTAASRGVADHGWLTSYQSFSFSGYYNPERMHFGALRVLNDDIVAGGKGFGTHPHDNMEIISIPMEGSLEHKDNMGNTKVVKAGEIQIMSTGKGVFHSEYNASPDQPAKFLQIWLFPNQLNVEPRYDQALLPLDKMRNQLSVVLGPVAGEAPTWLHQDAWFSLGDFDQQKETTYTLHKKGHGVYVFVISGSFTVDGQVLNSRDGMGIEGADSFAIQSLENKGRLLLMEVPMHQ